MTKGVHRPLSYYVLHRRAALARVMLFHGVEGIDWREELFLHLFLESAYWHLCEEVGATHPQTWMHS